MKEFKFGSEGGPTFKHLMDTFLLPRKDKVMITSRCPEDKFDIQTILNPGDVLDIKACKNKPPPSVTGAVLWTGMRFVKR